MAWKYQCLIGFGKTWAGIGNKQGVFFGGRSERLIGRGVFGIVRGVIGFVRRAVTIVRGVFGFVSGIICFEVGVKSIVEGVIGYILEGIFGKWRGLERR